MMRSKDACPALPDFCWREECRCLQRRRDAWRHRSAVASLAGMAGVWLVFPRPAAAAIFTILAVCWVGSYAIKGKNC